ncbi:hypothetical protein [Flavobacterium sp. '19STA2R22 D10 B1']|uniref:hypothetical protein n=1 Tax=Flavobacterium aerium TaxID=3037261 RepID=UPI00278C24A0|nr:hypothetical protein [Flavobacterium sp. '19STA2R22 D10 B1']
MRNNFLKCLLVVALFTSFTFCNKQEANKNGLSSNTKLDSASGDKKSTIIPAFKVYVNPPIGVFAAHKKVKIKLKGTSDIAISTTYNGNGGYEFNSKPLEINWVAGTGYQYKKGNKFYNIDEINFSSGGPEDILYFNSDAITYLPQKDKSPELLVVNPVWKDTREYKRIKDENGVGGLGCLPSGECTYIAASNDGNDINLSFEKAKE